MKPYELEAGDCFRVADACNPKEFEDFYEIVAIDIRKKDVAGRSIVVGVSMQVKVNGEGEPEPLEIGPWVEVRKGR